jgi:hypothetical protein
MQNHDHGAKRRMRTIALALFCGAAFAATPAPANPSYLFKTIATSDPTGTLGAFAGVGLASINDAGVVAFTASTWCAAGGFTCSGAFTIDSAGSLTTIISSSRAGTVPYQLFSEPVINHGGAVSFNVQNFGTVANQASSNWLDLWKGGVLRQAAPTRAVTAPATMVYVGPRLLNNSKIVVSDSEAHTLMTALKGLPPQPAAPGYCTTSNGTGSSLNGWVFTRGGPTASPCVDTGFLATYIPTGATQLRIPNDGTYGQLNNGTINASGTAAFSGKNLPGRTNVEGLFQQKVGGAVQKLAELDNGACANAPPPSGSCQYRGYFNSLATNPKGQVLGNVQISTWTAGNPNPSIVSGVTLNGDAVNGQIAWPGMVIDGCNVRTAQVGPRSLNKYGQIAILLTCNLAGGKIGSAVVVATPPIR